MVKTFRKKRRGDRRTKRKYYGGAFTITLTKKDLNANSGFGKVIKKNITILLDGFDNYNPNVINIPFEKWMGNEYIRGKIDEEIKKKFNDQYKPTEGVRRNNGLTINYLTEQLPLLKNTTSKRTTRSTRGSDDDDSDDDDSGITDELSDLSPYSTPRSRLSDGSSSISSLSLPSIPSSSSSQRSTHSSGSTHRKIDPLIEQGFLPKLTLKLPPIKLKTEEEKRKEDNFTQGLFKRDPILDEHGNIVKIGGGKSTHKRRRTFKKAATVPSTI